MKNAKKTAKKNPTKKRPAKPTKELTEAQLEQVAGGAAVDYFLKLEGVSGETQTTTTTTATEIGGTFYKIV